MRNTVCITDKDAEGGIDHKNFNQKSYLPPFSGLGWPSAKLFSFFILIWFWMSIHFIFLVQQSTDAMLERMQMYKGNSFFFTDS